MLDRERILAKMAELEGYVRELSTIGPKSFSEFQQIEKKRACERLLQISVEALIDICHLFVTGLKLGLPAEESDIFEKIERAGLISPSLKQTLQEMKGFRNILVHEHAQRAQSPPVKAGLASESKSAFLHSGRRIPACEGRILQYGEIDDKIVYQAVKTRLGDFEAFKQEVIKALEKAKA
jgi:uncharacterized protein YutE (UPF0331/DUF86 family)